MKIIINRINKATHFEVNNQSDLMLNIDGSTEVGGENKGFRPMELMLSGIASCATIDVLSILKKQRQTVDHINIEAIADRTNDDSKKFKSIHLHFTVTGIVLQDKMNQAIDLSVNKYCSAIQSLNSKISISTTFKIQEHEK